MNTNTLDILWDWIINIGIATDQELQLITSINGYNEKSLNDVIEVRTGYKNKEQYLYCEV